MIDLRSDTLTKPTRGMRRAMAEAEVGDEQKREDPTVIALEETTAALLGQEAAVYVPTATMANQIALRLHSEPGDEVIAEANAHIFRYELGGPAVHSGLSMRPIYTVDGRFGPEDVAERINPPGDLHAAPSRIVCVENTHNGGGGRVWPLEQLRAVVAEARKHGLAAHLDGARLMNAAVASGVPAAELGREFDSVTLCLSKGLGCPLGALLATSAEREPRARRFKHLFGGAMRQAGVVAAAGLYALEHHVERLADDHANARRLAEGLAGAGLPVDVDAVESNFVLLEAGRLGLSGDEVLALLRAEGVLFSFATAKDVLRAVTHLDVDAADVEDAIEAAARAMTAEQRPVELATEGPTPY
jgi:threonine aldolase